MEVASYTMLKSVRQALRYSLDTFLMDTSQASLISRTCRLYLAKLPRLPGTTPAKTQQRCPNIGNFSGIDNQNPGLLVASDVLLDPETLEYDNPAQNFRPLALLCNFESAARLSLVERVHVEPIDLFPWHQTNPVTVYRIPQFRKLGPPPCDLTRGHRWSDLLL